MQWYCTIGGEQIGPIDEDALRQLAMSGRLQPDDMVWNETMGDRWAAAATVAHLFDDDPPTQAATPSPLTSAHAASASPLPISCTSPVEAAWSGMKQILFAPFDIGKWFVLGFSAWLATLCEGGGGGGSIQLPTDWDEAMSGGGHDKFVNQLIDAESMLRDNVGIVVSVGFAIFLVIFVISLVVLWVRSRGRFMFLDNIVNNRTEIKYPWRAYKEHGNSLFWWSFGYGLICLAVAVVLLVVFVFSVVVPCVEVRSFSPAAWPGIWFAAITLPIYLLVIGYIERFLNDFVVPLMYNFDLTATEAWSKLFGLMRGRFP
ncbi:MAG: DUF4339 domain-containing protein, partial [Verrucomicrobia bacterium]|nr:DUF4339 domain-containing protein [Verrucomicrobiota bacterium]